MILCSYVIGCFFFYIRGISGEKAPYIQSKSLGVLQHLVLSPRVEPLIQVSDAEHRGTRPKWVSPYD
jgi:hypothetical protein